MKSLFLLFTLLALVSCGGGGGGGNNSKPERDHYEGDSTECLEEELNWLSSPPMTLKEALDDMKNSEYEKCGGLEEYSKQVQEKFENFSLLRK